MDIGDIDDEQLLHLVASTDKEFFDANMDIQHREFEVPLGARSRSRGAERVVARCCTPYPHSQETLAPVIDRAA